MNAHVPVTARLAPLAGRLGPLIGKLASDHDAEVLASVRAIRRLLDRSGLTLTDLGAALVTKPTERVVYSTTHDPPPAGDWLDMARYCASRGELLTEREAAFVRDMCRILRRPGTMPTERQAAWPRAIFDRLDQGI